MRAVYSRDSVAAASPTAYTGAPGWPAQRRSGLWLPVLNEVYKGLLIQCSYKFNLLTESFMLVCLFVGVLFFMGGGTLAPERLAPALIGYVVWLYAAGAISDMSQTLREEAQVGTLEQVYMSPVSTTLLLLGRTLANLLVATSLFVPVAMPLVLLLDIRLPLCWSALPVLLLTWLGIYGFGFIVGGATLLFKQVGALANLFQNMLLFLNGAFLPVEHFPPWLATIAHTLPSTQGIIVLRRVLLDGQSLSLVWAEGSLAWLLMHSACYCLVGWAIFVVCEGAARQRGVLGHY